MMRYPAFDPPEYVAWAPDAAVQAEFSTCLAKDPARLALIQGLGREKLLGLYAGLLRNRYHDTMLKRWVRQGILSKAWLGTGEEAVTIGAVQALEPGDAAAPVIRNSGALHERGMPLADIFRGALATQDGPTRGRDLHLGDMRYGLIAPISHVGSLVPVSVGVAVGFRLQRRAQVALTWVGDGSTRTGDFHEGLTMAAALQAPVVVIIQNNQVAMGTAVAQHFKGRLTDLAAAYGVAGGAFDGNNVLDAYATSALAVARARAGGGPSLLVAETFRMGGHATHDEREARAFFPANQFAYWGQRDPVGMFETWLCSQGQATVTELEKVEEEVRNQVETAAREALASRSSHPADPVTVAKGVYADG